MASGVDLNLKLAQSIVNPAAVVNVNKNDKPTPIIVISMGSSSSGTSSSAAQAETCQMDIDPPTEGSTPVETKLTAEGAKTSKNSSLKPREKLKGNQKRAPRTKRTWHKIDDQYYSVPVHQLAMVEKYRHVCRLRQITKMSKELSKFDRKSFEINLLKLKLLELLDNGSLSDMTKLRATGEKKLHVNLALSHRDNLEKNLYTRQRCVKYFRKTNNYPVEEGLLEYIVSCEETNTAYTREDLEQQAVAIASLLGIKNFVGSSLWMTCFLRRFSIGRTGENLKCASTDAAVKKMGLNLDESAPEPDNQEPGPKEDYCAPMELDSQNNLQSLSPINTQLVTEKKKAKPTSCRICSASLVDEGGMRLRDFNVNKAKQWVKDFVGYEINPVQKEDGTDFPFGICWNCVNNFHVWVKKFGENSQNYWTPEETAVWTAVQCKVDASTQTDEEFILTAIPFEEHTTTDMVSPKKEVCCEEDPLEVDVKPMFLQALLETDNVENDSIEPNLRDNLKAHYERAELLCPLCNKMFRVWRHLLKHNRECQMKTFPLKADLMRCRQCQFASFNDFDLKQHSCLEYEKSVLSILHVCTLCKVGFQTGIDFWKHVCL